MRYLHTAFIAGLLGTAMLVAPVAATAGFDSAGAKNCVIETKAVAASFYALSGHISAGGDSVGATAYVADTRGALARARAACQAMPEMLPDLDQLEGELRGIEAALGASG